MAFDPTTAKPLSAYAGADAATSDEMDKVDKAGGVVAVSVAPDGKVTNKSTAPKFDPSTAKPVEVPEKEREVKPLAIGDMIPQVGAAEAGANVISGAVAAPIAGLTGLGAAIGKAFGMTDADPADIIKRVQGALTYEPRAESAKRAVDVAMTPFEMLGKGANAVGEKAAEVTGSPAIGAAVNAGINVAAPMALTKGAQMVKGKLRAGAEASEAAALTKNQQAAEANRIISQSKEANYTLPPAQINPTVANKAVEGLSGSEKLAKRGSIKNQAVTNELIREDIGLPKDIPATRDAISAVRAEASKAYDYVKQVGTITNDAQYFKDLNNITKSYDTASQSYKGVANPVADVIKSLQETNVQAPAAIEMVKILRSKADTAYRTGDPSLGKAYKGAAQAIDDSLNRYLQTEAQFFGDPAMAQAVQKYQAARELIAKTYTAEKSLTPSGNFNAMVYARELKNNKPLNGNAKKVAEFASEFEKYAKLPESVGGDTFGFGDGIVAGARGMATGSASSALSAIGIRPAIRAVLTSKPYQKMIVNPKPATPSLGRMGLADLAELQSMPITSLAEMSAAQRK